MQQSQQEVQQPPLTTQEQARMVRKSARLFKKLLHTSLHKEISLRIKELIRAVVFGTVSPEVFEAQMQEALRIPPQPQLLPFLRDGLPGLREALINGEIVIEELSSSTSSGPLLTDAKRQSQQIVHQQKQSEVVSTVIGGKKQPSSPVFQLPGNQPIHQHIIGKSENSLQSLHEIISNTTRKRSLYGTGLPSSMCGPSRNWKEPALQTISQQPQADVLLDDLVIQRCITSLHFIDRIFHEGVNRRFAKMLYDSYHKTKISLTITAAYAFRGPAQRNPLANKREVIFAKEHEIYPALSLIFKRFRRFRCLRLCARNMDTVMEELLDTVWCYGYWPTYLRRLQLDFDDKALCGISYYVIGDFSDLLQELVVNGLWVTDDYYGKCFWSAVAKCSNLRKLSYNPECDVYGANDFVQTCVKKLNELTSFSSGRKIEFGNSYWLAQCFSDNEKLRNLSIASCYRSQMFTLSASSLTPLISKLKTIGMHFDKEHLPKDSIADILKIALSLPADGSLSVNQSLSDLEIDHLRHDWTHQLTFSIAQVLLFWLTLSEQMSRPVFLLLYFDGRTFPFANRLLKKLTDWPALSTECFNGITVTPLKNAMRVRLKGGIVKLAISRVGDST